MLTEARLALEVEVPNGEELNFRLCWSWCSAGASNVSIKSPSNGAFSLLLLPAERELSFEFAAGSEPLSGVEAVAKELTVSPFDLSPSPPEGPAPAFGAFWLRSLLFVLLNLSVGRPVLSD